MSWRTVRYSRAVTENRLDSWKEIASFLGRGLRTVQRWEREEQLPVHRLGHARRGTVYADRAELLAWWERRKVAPAAVPAPPIPTPAPALLRVTYTTTVTGFPALSSDARLVAFLADAPDGGPPQLWIQQVGGVAIRLTTGVLECSDPSFSADDTRVIFSARGERSRDVYEIPALGGAPRRLKRSARSARMSPDGRWLAYVSLDSPSGIRVAAMDGSNETDIATSLIDLRSVAWSPDSRHLLLYAHTEPSAEPDYWIAPVDGGPIVALGLTRSLRRLGFSVFTPLPPAWVPGAVLFPAVTRDGANIWRQRIAPGTFDLVGDPDRLTHGTEMAWYCAAAAGRMVFISTRFDVNLWSVAVDTSSGAAYGPLRRLTRGPGVLGNLSLTANGRTLAYFAEGPGVWRLTLRNLEDGSETVVAAGSAQAHPGFPAVSPAGAQLAYATRSTGPRTMRPIFIVDLPDGASRQVCEDCGGRPWQWLDERHLLIQTFGSRLNTVAVVDTATGEFQTLVAGDEFAVNNPRVSPDRRWVAFDAAAPWGSPGVYIAPLDPSRQSPESDWTVIDRDASHPCWSRDGRLLYYLPTTPSLETRAVVRARRLTAQTARPQGDPFDALILTELLVPVFLSGTAPLVAPDQLLLVLGDFRGDLWMRDLPAEAADLTAR
jgi:Tol biopolymer transport system component